MKADRKIIVALAVLAYPTLVSAYVDPGAGMLVWQSLVALIGLIITVARKPKEWARKILIWIRRKL